MSVRTGESRGGFRAAAPVCGFSRGTSKTSQGELNSPMVLLPIDTTSYTPCSVLAWHIALSSAHTLFPYAITPIRLHPLPQTNALLCSLSCFPQMARVTVRVNKHI